MHEVSAVLVTGIHEQYVVLDNVIVTGIVVQRRAGKLLLVGSPGTAQSWAGSRGRGTSATTGPQVPASSGFAGFDCSKSCSRVGTLLRNSGLRNTLIPCHLLL